MLSKKIYTGEYISELRGRMGDDPLIIERSLFAFGLLEAIKSVDIGNILRIGTGRSISSCFKDLFDICEADNRNG